MKKLILAPDSFKGTLSSIDVCKIMKSAALESFPYANIISMPFADGGDGFVDSMLYAIGGSKRYIIAKDPLMRDIEAAYGMLPNGTAVVEMAACSGVALLSPEEYSPLKTTTYGTGQLIRDALAQGCKSIVLGIGGSATTDGGSGMAASLGIHYLDSEGKAIQSGGEGLLDICSIDSTDMLPELAGCDITIACDVTNPLYGKNGAAYVFGPQKGASPEDVILLDTGLTLLGKTIMQQTGMDTQATPGTGAAGGIAVPLLYFAEAKLTSGIETILAAYGFDSALNDCDMVITGEGRSDYQSTMGKAVGGICQAAAKQGVPAVVISGSLGEGFEVLYKSGAAALFSACMVPEPEDMMKTHAAEYLTAVSQNVFRLLKLRFSPG